MNVLEVLDQYRIRYTTNHKDVRQGWVGISCPFCGRGKEQYLGINTLTAAVNCWRCGRHSLAEVIAELARIPLGAAIEAVKGLKRAVRPERPLGRLVRPDGVGPLLAAHTRYLRQRGLEAQAPLWNLQGIGIASRLQWRIYMPVYFHGEEISWTTRAIGDEITTRYVAANPEEEAAPAKSTLYGWDYVRNSVVVVEGPMDAVTLGPGAAATMGVGYTPAQVRLIASCPNRAICFDDEPEARRRAEELARALAPFPGVTEVIFLETGKDANSIDPDELREVRQVYLGDYC